MFYYLGILTGAHTTLICNFVSLIMVSSVGKVCGRGGGQILEPLLPKLATQIAPMVKRTTRHAELLEKTEPPAMCVRMTSLMTSLVDDDVRGGDTWRRRWRLVNNIGVALSLFQRRMARMPRTRSDRQQATNLKIRLQSKII